MIYIVVLALCIVAGYSAAVIGHSCWQVARRYLLAVVMVAAAAGATMAQTATPTPTPGYTWENYYATATAAAGLPQLETSGNQAYFGGRPLLPAINPQIFSYLKWLFSTGAQSIFGPFTPILLSLSGLFFLNLVFVVVYLLQNLFAIISKIAWWGFSLIIRLLRGG